MNTEKPAGSVGANTEPSVSIPPSGATGRPLTQNDRLMAALMQGAVLTPLTALTIAGTPAANDLCWFRVSRDVSDAADTHAEDARLIGIKLFLTLDAPTDT